jgi:predicted nucleic acid-binding protein
VEPRRVFVDTGAWFAVQVPGDEWHGNAVGTLRALLAGASALVTTNHVIGETYTLLRVVCGHAAAVRFLDHLEDTRRLERIFVPHETEARACRLLRQHADQDYSFVDATSFAVMRAERIRHAFAFDHHFSTAGFLRVPGDVPVEQV